VLDLLRAMESMMPSHANEFDPFISYIIDYLRSGYYHRKIKIDFKHCRILNYVALSAETCLLHDLGIYGDEAEEFLEDMHENIRLNIQNSCSMIIFHGNFQINLVVCSPF
jgi:hypothetical protein